MPASLHDSTVCAENIVAETVHVRCLCRTKLNCRRRIRRDSGRGLFVSAVREGYRNLREPKTGLFAESGTVLYLAGEPTEESDAWSTASGSEKERKNRKRFCVFRRDLLNFSTDFLILLLFCVDACALCTA